MAMGWRKTMQRILVTVMIIVILFVFCSCSKYDDTNILDMQVSPDGTLAVVRHEILNGATVSNSEAVYLLDLIDFKSEKICSAYGYDIYYHIEWIDDSTLEISRSYVDEDDVFYEYDEVMGVTLKYRRTWFN